MAGGGGGKVLLGFQDEMMASDTDHFTTSKIGGRPDWCLGSSALPQCGVCGSDLLLVTQIYAPLSSSPYHRTLYVFGCIQPPCWNISESWACYRSQCMDTGGKCVAEAAGGAPQVTKAVTNVTDWMEDADDWGDDNGNDSGNGNLSPDTISRSPDTTSSPSPVGAIGGFPISNFNMNTDTVYLDGNTSNLRPEDIPLQNLNLDDPMADRGQRMVGTRPRHKNLNDKNANVSPPGRGAVAHLGVEATAEIETGGEEESCIAIDTPELGNTNIPHLFSVASRKTVTMTGIRLVPHYIWVEEEAFAPPALSEHERQLLLEYKAKEAVEGVVAEGGGTGGKAEADRDMYEQEMPSHGDEYFHKLVTVIQNNPGQILRYCRESDKPPVFLGPFKEKVKPCKSCGGENVFEMQLLPSMVHKLMIPEVEGSPIEFGTVLIYTCKQSCWSSESKPKTEQVVVQGENM